MDFGWNGVLVFGLSVTGISHCGAEVFILTRITVLDIVQFESER